MRTVVLVAIILTSVFAFERVLIVIMRNDYPLQTPVSPSMVPTLNVGDLLIVQGVEPQSIIADYYPDGDIITFRKPSNPNEFIVHRAIEKIEHQGKIYFVTKGDNNNARDYWIGTNTYSGAVSEDYVIGKVIFVIPAIGYVKIILGTPTGIVASVVILIALLFLENLIPSRKDKNKKEDEDKDKQNS